MVDRQVADPTTRPPAGVRPTGRLDRTRVVVVAGGPGAEHDVSLASARSAVAHLDPSRYEVRTLVVGRDGRWHDDGGPLTDAVALVAALTAADVVLPLVHGALGEDGTLAGLLDVIGVPYVGSGVRAGAIGMDKHTTKLVAADLGIAVAPGVLLDVAGADADPARWPARAAHLRGALFVKPCHEGSSHGVVRVEDRGALVDAVHKAASFGSRVLVEQGVEGREVDVAVLGPAGGDVRLSPPLEIQVDDGFFDTGSKYDGTARLVVPAAVDDATLATLHRHTLALHARLGCAGVARFDYFLTAQGPVLNEVNTLPGLTSESQVPRMFAAAGLPYADLLATLLDDALGAAVTVRPDRAA